MNIDLKDDEILFLEGETGIVGISKMANCDMLFIETSDNEEIVLYPENDDIIAVSAFGKGEKYKKGIRALTYLTRDMQSPILILPKENNTSNRLQMVLSVGDTVRFDCNITPGTHPEQDILCSCDSLSGITIEKTSTGISLNKDNIKYKIEKF
ncbi:MAG: hypothetical protein ACI4VU_05690 [Methanobrevibacter sp.]